MKDLGRDLTHDRGPRILIDRHGFDVGDSLFEDRDIKDKQEIDI